MTNHICRDSGIEIKSNDGWVNIKDKLPEIDKRVLLYLINNEITIGIYTHFGFCSTERFRDDILNVTHWRYLPSPPESE